MYRNLSPLEEELNYTYQPHLREILYQEIHKQGEGRGSPTRGWRAASPQRGRERHELLNKCGNKCFLLPEEEKFPICAKLESGNDCQIDCRGVQAAYNRARQYKYQEVANKAGQILEKDCGRIPRSRSPNRRNQNRYI